MASVRGKVVVLTGASAGIGRETAVRLARRGATVVAAARDTDRLARLAGEAPGVVPVRCDVTVAADRAALVSSTLDAYGRIDALVNNAGLGWQGLVSEMPLERVEYLYALNVVGLIEFCHLALPSMLAARSGHIVNVSSMAGYVAFPPYAVYCSTKHAVNGFTDALRREVRGRGVRVHLVLPGPIETEFIPRANGVSPPPGSEEARVGGFPAWWVAAAIERCLRRPYPRVVAVPRVFGAGRLVQVTGFRQVTDLVLAGAARTYASRYGPPPPDPAAGSAAPDTAAPSAPVVAAPTVPAAPDSAAPGTDPLAVPGGPAGDRPDRPEGR
jgi:short-subunit dehydrogenase